MSELRCLYAGRIKKCFGVIKTTSKEALEYWQFRYEYEKAKNYYDRHLGEYEYRKHTDYVEALKISIEVLEKQIPKRLTIKLSEQMIQGYLYRDKCCYCPMCDSFRGNLDYEPQKIRKYDFCPDCGQALDWGDSNE